MQVRVSDTEGSPVPDAWVMTGGAPERDWVATDRDGQASVEVTDDGLSERAVMAGKEGWHSSGVDIDDDEPPETTLAITLSPLPTEDNPGYSFQAGGDGSSPDTTECGHCHWQLGDDWASSAHASAASNAVTWDLYTGSASTADADACEDLGGAFAEGQTPGEEGTTTARCYTDQGVLPWLNDCVSANGEACDHPDRRGALEHLGSCGDCHSPAIDGAPPGQVDLASAFGVGFEGVTCDLCHKIQSVIPGGAPGLDGGFSLLRPSEDTTMSNQEFAPIIFGPYPDVTVPIMRGSYTPQMRTAGWCSACHEYAQPALRPDQALDGFPDGLPVLETWSEFLATSGGSDLVSCGTCHMPAADVESSTYDITEHDLMPSASLGWLREAGEVRHHTFAGADALTPPALAIALEQIEGGVEASVTVSNLSAGHAVPTGEPMKQLLVVVSARNDGGAVVATGGAVVPDVGGSRASGEVGESVTVDDTLLVFSGPVAEGVDESALVARFVRPTGAWIDYPGPGAGPFADPTLTAEERGIEELSFLGQVEVNEVSGEAVRLITPAPQTQAGDRVYLCAEQDHAGAPGALFAKILVDAEGNRGVAHYRAVDVASDNRIALMGSATTTHTFPLPADGGALVVTATLIRRDRAMPVAELYGWDPGDEQATAAEAELSSTR